MDTTDLIWKTNGSRTVFHSRVFDVREKECEAGNGLSGNYYVIDAPEWVVTLPVRNGNFLLVRQWRHGAEQLMTEFPGGVMEKGETPAMTAARETEEETGFRAGKLTCLGTVNPNPALFSNRFHVFLAEELTPVGGLHTDEDEFLNVTEVPISEVIGKYGTGEFLHAFMGTALAFYMRYRLSEKGTV